MEIRRKPYALKVYEALAFRKTFSKEDRKKYRKLMRGYEGEIQFDHILEKIPGDYILLKDLLLSQNDRYFQIDHVLLINNTLYLYDVKNFIGEYYYQDDKLWHISNHEVDDPLTQLKRTESLLRQLLQHHDFPINILSTVVFINSEFTLFQALRTPEILLPTQVNRYMRQFDHPAPMTDASYQIANTLKKLNKEHSPFQLLPNYKYEELKKGLRCKTCARLVTSIKGKSCICDHCNKRELLQSAILRNIQEFQTLYPNDKLTAKMITDWCGIEELQRRVPLVLNKNFLKSGDRKGAYYI